MIVSTYATLTILLNPIDPASRYYDARRRSASAHAAAAPRSADSADLVPVVAEPIARSVELPGEIHPFLTVWLHAKIPGYVDRILVDRGSVVNQGRLLAELSAPEISARIAEAESKVQQSESERLQAEAQFAAAQSAYERLKKAAETPGAVAAMS